VVCSGFALLDSAVRAALVGQGGRARAPDGVERLRTPLRSYGSGF
jgi:hypothetical protein